MLRSPHNRINFERFNSIRIFTADSTNDLPMTFMKILCTLSMWCIDNEKSSDAKRLNEFQKRKE